jgi:hypothetical protein
MSDAKNDDKLVLEDVQLMFRNFSGAISQYNAEGKRDFCVVLQPALAIKMKTEGWNVRTIEGRTEGDEPRYYMNVAVSFDHYPPTINLVTGDNETTLISAEDIGMLDWAEIASADMTIRPYPWAVNGNTGIKAYLKSLFVRIVEDPLAAKYTPKVSVTTETVPADEPNRPSVVVGDGSPVV